MKKPIFTGAGVAIVTPFTEDNKINYPVLKDLIEFQIENGTDAIIICGTTGEGATLEHDEHVEAIRFTVETVAGRIPVIASTGSNDTEYSLKLSLAAQEVGADALLLITPYYNKASQQGLIKHFTYVADRVNIPIILYNVPSRTGCEIKPETYAELCKHPMIYGTKEATGNLSAIAKTISLCDSDFAVYSGNDDQITAIASLFFPISARRLLTISLSMRLTATSKRVRSFSLNTSSSATICLWTLTRFPLRWR